METVMTTPSMKDMFPSRAVDPSRLEELGKTAARLAETSGLRISDAVVETLGREKLNSEQVRRVVEYANTELFNQKFAATSGSLHAVHFDGGPADPAEVLQALNDAARPRTVTVDALEYALPPDSGAKFSSVDASIDRTIDGVFHETAGLHRRLEAAHDELVQSTEATKGEMAEALVDLAQSVKSASADGASPEEIYLAWAAESPEVAKVAFRRLHVFMRPTNVKVAGRSINPAHRVMRDFTQFAKLAQSYAHHHEALMSVEAELLKVSAWLSKRKETYAA
jgi:hypothetical protein